MKIAQVCPNYYPYMGGVETLVNEISKRLVLSGFHIDVLTTDPSRKLPKEEFIEGVNVKRFKSWAPGEAYYFSLELNRFLNKNSNKYDIVHSHSYAAFPSFYAAWNKDNNKLIFNPHYHGSGHTVFRSLLHIPYKFLGKKNFERADKIVCVSNYEKNLVLKNFLINEEKIIIIPNGIKLDEFNRLEKHDNLNKTILYVGRLEKYKGLDYLIKIMPEIDDDIILNIVGKGPYRNRLNKLISRLDVEHKIIFYQDLSREALLQKYADADLFVLLSRHEAYGITVAEALASGTPCIVSDSSALQEWIDNKNCFGISFPYDLAELKNLINAVIGRKIQEINLIDWNEVVSNLMKLYSCV